MRRTLLVLLFLKLGALLIVAPWTRTWERNFFLDLWPMLRPWLMDDRVRGAISGLGFLNVVGAWFEFRRWFAVGRGTPPSLPPG
ncbi:MAG: hypothetical protein FJW29_02760 [Acidobacteria bacterium]|nr:hypothetical protein [Acidobacteriota bacterium]